MVLYCGYSYLLILLLLDPMIPSAMVCLVMVILSFPLSLFSIFKTVLI